MIVAIRRGRRSSGRRERFLRRISRQHEGIGLARLEKGCLLVLTACHRGAVLLTADPPLQAIRVHVLFTLRMLELGR